MTSVPTQERRRWQRNRESFTSRSPGRTPRPCRASGAASSDGSSTPTIPGGYGMTNPDQTGHRGRNWRGPRRRAGSRHRLRPGGQRRRHPRAGRRSRRHRDHAEVLARMGPPISAWWPMPRATSSASASSPARLGPTRATGGRVDIGDGTDAPGVRPVRFPRCRSPSTRTPASGSSRTAASWSSTRACGASRRPSWAPTPCS